MLMFACKTVKGVVSGCYAGFNFYYTLIKGAIKSPNKTFERDKLLFII